tara:strand:+ start:2951 stop:3151 length:201 start_codon:yes stop_codon:yes gene_type:complete
MKYILPAMLIVGTAVFGMNVIETALSLPDVQFSMMTEQCVRVLNYVDGENYTCDNLPTKFNYIWVK